MKRKLYRLLSGLTANLALSGFVLGAEQSEMQGRMDGLQIDPLLIVQARQVWNVVGNEDNPIWPGWDSSQTPLLFYLPNQQDVLVRHPDPPEGFKPLLGPPRLEDWELLIRNGKTFFDLDGQNTTRAVNGVRTLVVADTLSNQRQRVGGLINARVHAAGEAKDASSEPIEYSSLATDPYDQMATVAHEAFHVFQERQAKFKFASELALLQYPTLSPTNNAGFAMEGRALAEALQSENRDQLLVAARKWLAIRTDRRKSLTQEDIAYEDGTEFSEGLAKYVEYRLYEVLEGMTPEQDLWWAQGFHGFEDLSGYREHMIDQMVMFMAGEVNVNNDPYGTAPVRLRHYFSGMGIAALLDLLENGRGAPRAADEWKTRIFSRRATLTNLVQSMLGARDEELEALAKEIRKTPAYTSAVEKKRILENEGKRDSEKMARLILEGKNTTVIIDHAPISPDGISLSFTPFGVRRLDEERVIYLMVPIEIGLGENSLVRQTVATPLLHDRGERRIAFQLQKVLSRRDLLRAIGLEADEAIPEKAVEKLTLDLPGATVELTNAKVEWAEGENLILRLVE